MNLNKNILTADGIREKRKLKLNNNLILLTVFFILFIVFSLSSKNFLTINNITTMFRNSVVAGIIALGLTPLMISRGIDISFGSNIGLTSAVVAILYTSGMNIFLALLVGVIVSTVCSFINGILIESFKLNALIATLGTMSVYLSLSLVLTKGNKPISVLADPLLNFAFGYSWKLPNPVWIFIVLILIYHIVLRYTVTGRVIYLIGANPLASYSCGIKVKKVRIVLYTFFGLMVGIASIFAIGFSGTGNAYLGAGLTLPTLSAILLGGIGLEGGSGNIWGTVLGILIVNIIFNGLSLMGIPANIIDILQGFILITIVSIYTFNSKRGKVAY